MRILRNQQRVEQQLDISKKGRNVLQILTEKYIYNISAVQIKMMIFTMKCVYGDLIKITSFTRLKIKASD